MQQLSVVIVCKNEADIIDKTLQSLQGLTDDIVVYDNGSTDGTLEKLKAYNLNVHQGCWEGFGKTKRKAIALAKYDWILAIDADEVLSEKLKNNLLSLLLTDENTIYEAGYDLYFKNKLIRFGEWAGETFTPLFNRKVVNWDDAIVHEKLLIPQGVKTKKLSGKILHYSIRDIEKYIHKRTYYARLCADKYFLQGRRAGFFHRYFAAAFVFIKYYFFKLGFLDGWEGFFCAKVTSYYTFIKYARLLELKKCPAGK
ncbi:MAG: glycosyltransferase family 2 protein [Chitinophagaceae bacterium]